MATSVAARGPLTVLLQSTGGQYVALGLGVYALFPDQVQRALAPLLGHSAISQFGYWRDDQGNLRQSQQPIIIHTPSPTVVSGDRGGNGSSKSWTTVIIYSIAGAGACWVGYIVCSQLLPDAVSEFMPVTKRLFKSTTERLGVKIVELREVFQEQLSSLLQKQETLEQQQDETHKSVKDVHSDLSEARVDMLQLQHSLDRCEAGLEHSNNMQGYTLRGIRLLVRCVTSFLPDESNFIEDISRYIEEGHGQQQQQPGDHNTKMNLGDPNDPHTYHKNNHYNHGSGGQMMRSQSQPPADPHYYHQQQQQQAQPPLPQPSSFNRGNMMMGRQTSMPAPLPHPSKVFGNGSATTNPDYTNPDFLSAAPSITSIDSSEDDSQSNNNNNFSMGDIRALLGH